MSSSDKHKIRRSACASKIKWDMLKLSSTFEGSFNPDEFTEEELAEMLGLEERGESIEDIRRRYFEEHDDVKDRTLAIKKWSE